MVAPIRAVLFDVDDTLWDFQRAQLTVTSAVLDRTAQRDPRVTSLSAPRVVAIRREIGRASTEDNVVTLRRLTFRQALAEVEVTDEQLVDSLTDQFLEGLTHDLPLFAQSRAVLDWCRDRFRLGVVSNGTKGPQAGGIGEYFEVSVLGPVEGISKPDPRLFLLAIERMGGLTPDEVVMVGDNDHIDVAGAQAAGMRAILVDHHANGSGSADAVVAQIGDVPAALAAMSERSLTT